MEKFVVTKEMLAAARDYIPMAQKEAFAKNAAVLCIDSLTVPDYPPYYRANPGRVSRAMAAALAGIYLGQSVEMELGEDGEGWLASEAEYDRLAFSHIFGQLQRLKSDMAVRDKIFDLLSDYGELERMLKSEIDAAIAPRNDVAVRMTMLSMDAMKQLPEIQKQLEELRARQNAEKAGEGVLSDA